MGCNCCKVQGGPGISPRESQRRTTGGVTLHTAAAWRTEGDPVGLAHHAYPSGLSFQRVHQLAA
jgi:hypothetical protein